MKSESRFPLGRRPPSSLRTHSCSIPSLACRQWASKPDSGGTLLYSGETNQKSSSHCPGSRGHCSVGATQRSSDASLESVPTACPTSTCSLPISLTGIPRFGQHVTCLTMESSETMNFGMSFEARMYSKKCVVETVFKKISCQLCANRLVTAAKRSTASKLCAPASDFPCQRQTKTR